MMMTCVDVQGQLRLCVHQLHDLGGSQGARSTAPEKLCVESARLEEGDQDRPQAKNAIMWVI